MAGYHYDNPSFRYAFPGNCNVLLPKEGFQISQVFCIFHWINSACSLYFCRIAMVLWGDYMSDEKNFKKMCLCPSCPTYVNCKELTFCLDGKSKCIKDERGCLCPGCPVQNKLNFKHAYYCIRDSEKQQHGKK
jgi:hypothetical protein